MRGGAFARFDSPMRERIAVLARSSGWPPPEPGRSAVQLLRGLLADADIDTPLRAWACLLAATGSYPTQDDVDALRPLLELSRPDEAWDEVRRAVDSASRRALARRLTPSGPLVVDVTRTSRAVETTGIPRVALGLASIAQERQGQLLVWEDGVPGLVEMPRSGQIDFDPDLWSSARQRRRLLARAKTSYWWLLGRLSLLPGGTAITRTARALIAPLANALFSRGGPDEALLLTRCRYVMPEVPIPDSVSRLLPWIDATHAGLGPGAAGYTRDTSHLATAVHDFLPISAAHFFAEDQRVGHIDFCRLVAASDSIVVASPHLVGEVHAMREIHGARRPAEVIRIPYGIDAHRWGLAPQQPSRHPEFLMIGSMEARKNHRLALLALGNLAIAGVPTTLHVVGGRRPVSALTIRALRFARDQGVEVVEHVGTPDSTVRGLMGNCVASMYLSWAEGYGLPVLESLALGLPVIASDIPPNRDHLAYGGVVLVQPDRPDELSALLGRMIRDPAYVESLRGEIRTAEIPFGFEAWASSLIGCDTHLEAEIR